MLIWDQADSPTTGQGVLAWQSHHETDLIRSVPRYVEEHAERLRAKYLGFIHELGQHTVRGRSVAEHLDVGDGFSMWWMSEMAEKSPFKCPRIYDSLRLLALEEILLAGKPTGLELVTANPDLAAAIARLCRNLGVGFRWQRSPAPPWTWRLAFEWLPAPVQGLIALGQHVLQRWPLRSGPEVDWFAGKKAVFFCSYFIHLDAGLCAAGRFHTRLWGALPELLQTTHQPANWLHHFLFSAAVPDVQTGRRWLDLFNREPSVQGQHAFLEAFLSWGVVTRALRRWLWLNRIDWRLRHVDRTFSPSHSAVWLWPILRRDWKASLIGVVAIKNCLWLELFDRALGEMPRQATGLYIWENQGWERALLRAWRKHGHGEIFGVQHATVALWHTQNFCDARTFTSGLRCALPLPDRLAINGAGAFRAFVASGFPRERLIEVEALRYLHLGRLNSPAERDAGAAKPKSVRVLVLGDILPVATHGLLRLLSEAAQRLEGDFVFTLKPHPAYRVDPKDYPKLQLQSTTEALDRILADYDLALATNSTSAAVEAFLSGLPVVVGLDGAALNLSPLRGQPGVVFVGDVSQLAQALQSSAIGSNRRPGDFFHLDPHLPRWKKLLGLNSGDLRPKTE